MPLPLAHGLLGASLVAVFPLSTKRYFMLLLTGAFFANLADLDFILVLTFIRKPGIEASPIPLCSRLLFV